MEKINLICQKFENFSENNTRNHKPNFERSRLNGVAKIERTNIHSYIVIYKYTAEQRYNTLKKFSRGVIRRKKMVGIISFEKL